MDQLLIATNNPGKLYEFQSLLCDFPIQLLTPADLGLDLKVVEDGSTYTENATHKALAFATASGILSLADDSGLEVDILNGQPGLYSARFSSLPQATDFDRRQNLLARLAGKPRPWQAQFRCVVAIAKPHHANLPESNIHYAEGTCQGEIIPEERGENGFGYDPIFLLSDINKTMAELTMTEKNQLSHRAHAVMNAIPILKQILHVS